VPGEGCCQFWHTGRFDENHFNDPQEFCISKGESKSISVKDDFPAWGPNEFINGSLACGENVRLDVLDWPDQGMTLEQAMETYPDGVGKGDNRPLSLVGPATNLGDAKAAMQFVMTWYDDTADDGAINLCGDDGPTC
jgi:hypothetical protein